MARARRILLLSSLLLFLGACSGGTTGAEDPGPIRHGSIDRIIPRPASVETGPGAFRLRPSTSVRIVGGNGEAADAVALLHALLRPATGLPLPVTEGDLASDSILLTFSDTEGDLGEEGHVLRVRAENVEIVAQQRLGFIWAVQTLRQLMAPEIDGPDRQTGTWEIPSVTIRDTPRFAWRGMLFDVARHFFTVADVERVIDLLSTYKMNRLHLHLTDDQGWRLEIKAYPDLTNIGSATETDGGPGGFYTQEEYRGLIDYAERRGVMIVPEIDMPGHVTAALTSIPELNCDGQAAPPFTGLFTWSTLCVGTAATSTFAESVIREVSALSPSPYFHVGGDEAMVTDPADYALFLQFAADAVRRNGKELVGWQEIGAAGLTEPFVAQIWKPDASLPPFPSMIVSSADKAYLDMPYDASSRIGAPFFGYIDTKIGYDWDPAAAVSAPDSAILGIEAELWTHFVTDNVDVDYLTLPRLPGYAELGWSKIADHDWGNYSERLAAQASRWSAEGYGYYRDPVVPWPD